MFLKLGKHRMIVSGQKQEVEDIFLKSGKGSPSLKCVLCSMSPIITTYLISGHSSLFIEGRALPPLC